MNKFNHEFNSSAKSGFKGKQIGPCIIDKNSVNRMNFKREKKRMVNRFCNPIPKLVELGLSVKSIGSSILLHNSFNYLICNSSM